MGILLSSLCVLKEKDYRVYTTVLIRTLSKRGIRSTLLGAAEPGIACWDSVWESGYTGWVEDAEGADPVCPPIGVVKNRCFCGGIVRGGTSSVLLVEIRREVTL